MMKIPRKIKIASHKVTIKKVKNITGPLQDSLGYADLTQNRIVLRQYFNGLPLKESTKTEAFLHEVIHEICELYGITWTEKLVRQISAALLQVIRDNKIDLLNLDE
jgi:hypothetical protein